VLDGLGGDEVVRRWQGEDAQPAVDEGRGAGGYDGPGDLGGGGGEAGAEGARTGDFDGVGAEEGGDEGFGTADIWGTLVGAVEGWKRLRVIAHNPSWPSPG
jgi:hypothetical protein